MCTAIRALPELFIRFLTSVARLYTLPTKEHESSPSDSINQ